MVKVVFAEIILGQVRNVRKLNMWYVRRPKYADIHFCWSCLLLALSVCDCFVEIPVRRKLVIFRQVGWEIQWFAG